MESVGEVEAVKENSIDQNECEDQKKDSSVFPTAFTISFDDDGSATKKFGIRDSIRKFAPPKPNTIEKPRQIKNDTSLDQTPAADESTNVDTSPKQPHSKENCSSSSKSSGPRSNSSRHSNINDSAAFLIDRMLNFKQTDEATGTERDKNLLTKSPSSLNRSVKTIPPNKQHATKRMAHSSDDILIDSEIDFCDDKSDNGTYIVGTDPESDAARKEIGKLFGVIESAGASIIADSKKQRSAGATSNKSAKRQSRPADKKPLTIPYRPSSVSRSSSSSRQENASSSERQRNHNDQKASSRHPRNSSCERSSRNNHISHRQARRSISQSSRQSSNKELSEGDTRSSRSSLHLNDVEVSGSTGGHDNSLPNMKFNRAFALRRARLGLGEPIRVSSSTNQKLETHVDSSEANFNNLSSSQRRHQINTNTYKAAYQGFPSTASASFCREDGGRFSLRMKNNIVTSNRLASQHPHHHQATTSLAASSGNQKSPQQSALFESYISKISGAARLGAYFDSQHAQPRSLSIAKYHYQPQNSSTSLPYSQSGDELEPMMSPSRYRLMKLKSNNRLATSQRKASNGGVDVDVSDSESYSNITNNNRFNYQSFGVDYDPSNAYSSLICTESRAGSSIGTGGGKVLQVGALDSLVISAISSLSLKIRTSICEILVEQAKKLPVENETRLIVEEILPELVTPNIKSPTSVEEIDQSLSFDLTKTLKNLKKMEQMIDVINLISNQLHTSASSPISSSTPITESKNL